MADFRKNAEINKRLPESGMLSCMICEHLILIAYDTILEFTPGVICCSVMMLSISIHSL